VNKQVQEKKLWKAITIIYAFSVRFTLDVLQEDTSQHLLGKTIIKFFQLIQNF
jgi:hypothetical protein